MQQFMLYPPEKITAKEAIFLLSIVAVLLILWLYETWREKQPRIKNIYCIRCFNHPNRSQFEVGNWFHAKKSDRCESCKEFYSRLVEASPRKNNWFSRLIRRFRK